LTDGDLALVVVAVLCVLVTIGIAGLVLPADLREVGLPIVLFATLMRMAIAIVLYDGLVAAGRNGFVTGDDALYALLSSRLAEIMHGRPAVIDQDLLYLVGTYVHLESWIFYVVGAKPLAAIFVNAAMGGLLVGLIFDIVCRIFRDSRPAIVAALAVSVYPSLVLWSALNLKDSLALLLIAIVLWMLVIFHSRRIWWLIPASFLPVLLMEDLRNYIFVGLALVIPPSILFAPGGTPRHRLLASTAAMGITAVLLLYHFGYRQGIPSPSDFDAQRGAMQFGANVVFGDQPLIIRSAFVFFAPFPWMVRRMLDLFPVPEMLLWYLALAGACLAMFRYKRFWRAFAPLLLFCAWTFVIFLLAEGNVGTLFRHRAMVIPFVIILSAPALSVAIQMLGLARRVTRMAGPNPMANGAVKGAVK